MHKVIKYFKTGNLLLTAVLLLIVTQLQAQEFKYNDAWGDAGISLKSQDIGSLKVSFSIHQFSLTENMIDGTPMQSIHMPNVLLPGNEGAPDLPGYGRYIAIPQGAVAKINVLNIRTETIKGVEMAPAPRIPLDTEDGPLEYEKNEKLYNTNAFYPAEPFMLSKPTQLRGVDASVLGITPFQYNPVTKELVIYRDVEVEVIFEGGTGNFGDDHLRSRWFDPIIQDAVLNAESLPKIDYSARSLNQGNRDDVGCEYLIVVPNDPLWMPYAEQIKEWRTLQGISTDIKTLDEIGDHSVSGLENYFNNAYDNWDVPPVAVLLMADYGTNGTTTIVSPVWESYCVSDNIFADVNDNSMPDIIFARMTAHNEEQLNTMVSKMLDYEANPPTNSDFYHRPITALGWQTERWFQICSETVGGYWREVKGKEPVRINEIYQGNPGNYWSTNSNTPMVVDYFGPDGLGYIPATPAELGGWAGGNSQMVINAINDGAFAIQHRDHGMETGWGEPSFLNSHINQLTNTEDNEMPYIFSINCLTGEYDMSGECFAEKFHRHTHNGENAGALGILAASEVSYSFVNDTYVWGLFDNIYPDFMPDYGQVVPERGFLPAFANAAGKYFLEQSQWPSNPNSKEVTYNLFHHHGGAFMQVYSEVPQELTVSHDPVLLSGLTGFPVFADEGSFIALTVDGEIIGTATSEGGSTEISIPVQEPGNIMIVTVTKQDYFRYQTDVEIIPAEGAFVIADSYVVNDELENNNGMMDYAESVSLNMTMKNVGVELGQNIEVTLSTTDEFIAITNNTASFGNIDPDGNVTIDDAFSLDVNENIPDQHLVTFLLEATNGTDTWESNIYITGHAPVLGYADFTIDDSNANNNQQLDPGEVATMYVHIKNSGSADAYNVLSALSSNDNFVSVLITDPQEMGDVAAGETGMVGIIVSANESIPAGHMAELIISSIADLGVTQEDTFDVLFPDICYPYANCSQGDGLRGFGLGDISNFDNGCSNAGYGDFTDMSTTLVPGETYTVQLKAGYSNQYVTLWIDINDNKHFDEEEMLITDFVIPSSSQIYETEITIPDGLLYGEKLLRVRARWQNSSISPCEDFEYGETEDYTVVIDGLMLLPPQNVEAFVMDEDDVSISWNEPLTENVLGYNVFRNSALIAEEITELEFMDMELMGGTYVYQVSAVYAEGESFLAGPAVVTIILTYEPIIVVSQMNYDFSVYLEGTEIDELELGNDGEGDLEYTVTIEYSGTEGWLDLDQMNGIILPGATDALQLMIDAQGLAAEMYTATIKIESNDPETPMVEIAVTLEVTDECPEPAPENLSAQELTAFVVYLDWDEPGNSTVDMMGYNVYRDGMILNDGLIEATEFTDNDAPAGNTEYVVSAVWDLCESYSEPTYTMVTSVGEIVGQQTSIYPNPARDEVNIISDSQLLSVKVMTTGGQMIINQPAEGKNIKLNTSSLMTGIYLMEIQTTNGLTVEKLLIK